MPNLFLIFLLLTSSLFTSSSAFAALPEAASEKIKDTPATKSESSQPQEPESSLGPKDNKPETEFGKEAKKQSPSFQEKKWTGTQGTSETFVHYDYVGKSSTNLGNGKNGDVEEQVFEVQHFFMRHTLLAFLVQGGVEAMHMGFESTGDSLVPSQLNTVAGSVGIDFRWSRKDLLHIEAHPGLYTDFQGAGWDAFNTPLDVGYTHVSSRKFQWILGFSLNTWRSSRYLGAGGFRWQINDRWKIKAYLPTPAVEFTVMPNMNLSIRADIRGDTYRVGPTFGDKRNTPALNNALVDFQEVRVGPGVSWNVRPTIALDLMAGYMVGRQYDFHNAGIKLNGTSVPFVSVGLHALFKLPGETLRIPQTNRVSFRDIFKYF